MGFALFGALFFALTSALTATPAIASADLAKAKNCLACHAAEKKLIGPSYKDIAAKYSKDAGAAKMLAEKIQKGGVGVWGQIPMPANPQVSAGEAETLAKWVLAAK
jgi:cytochrome c